MKKTIITLLSMLFCIPGFPQNTTFEYGGRITPSAKQEKLPEATFISDLAPQLWERMLLPSKERFELHLRRSSEGYYSYNTLIDYVSVSISATNKGKVLTAQGISDKLTSAQKSLLHSVDPGTDINIHISFRYKISANDTNGSRIINGELTVTAVPETEAEFPGGYKQFGTYLTETFFAKITNPLSIEKIQQAIIDFTINEKGEVVDAHLFRISNDKETDRLLLEAIRNMPNWKPATNSKGIKVKQQFRIPLSAGC
ncbi:MAG: energy transducer TonB [Bacteroidota bacterium]